ncbi:beta-galactosamide-alpha-2,3-sialyltransferase [Psychrobacter sp. PL15]|uniref:glycosyltransferase family 52 n=1 Tax=Psychrobacter sp. PL15 TaxID=3071719 RepID=UPI002E083B52|nr:beta-galactosamide-alpha-2,3-sialyltransferase [Psychrobacter sp. PL15]
MSISSQKSRSLIMCATPLQMLIAEKIIELNKEKEFDLLVLAPSNNDKYYYYYQKLKTLCLDSLYYVDTKSSITSFLSYIGELKRGDLDKRYQNLYLANIDFRHFHYLISRNSKSSIYTFDDGIANVIPNNIYSSSIRLSIWKRTISYLIGINTCTANVKKLSLLHYTLYKDVPNIVSPTEYISLYNNKCEENITNKKVFKFYLGQPMTEVNDSYCSDYIHKTLEKLDIDFYFPHPRENYDITKVKVINSQLIFEEYIINFLNKNTDSRVEIYSFISTASLNLTNINTIKSFYICDKFLSENYKDFYNLASEKFNINIIRV